MKNFRPTWCNGTSFPSENIICFLDEKGVVIMDIWYIQKCWQSFFLNLWYHCKNGITFDFREVGHFNCTPFRRFVWYAIKWSEIRYMNMIYWWVFFCGNRTIDIDNIYKYILIMMNRQMYLKFDYYYRFSLLYNTGGHGIITFSFYTLIFNSYSEFVYVYSLPFNVVTIHSCEHNVIKNDRYHLTIVNNFN